MSLSKHDILAKAMVNILAAFGFEVQYKIKGKETEKILVTGDSGLHYYPDFIATKGYTILVGDMRTRAQRGTKDKIDRYVVQFLQAELDDMTAKLKRPHGLIVTAHGSDNDAIQLADHFGIYLVHLPLDVAQEIANLDPVSQRQKIIEMARKNKIEF